MEVKCIDRFKQEHPTELLMQNKLDFVKLVDNNVILKVNHSYYHQCAATDSCFGILFDKVKELLCYSCVTAGVVYAAYCVDLVVDFDDNGCSIYVYSSTGFFNSLIASAANFATISKFFSFNQL
jgi:hypothetical protein